MAKKVLIVGATGGTGRSLVEQALTAGHSVTAFVRNPEKVGRHHERLRVVAGAARSGCGDQRARSRTVVQGRQPDSTERASPPRRHAGTWRAPSRLHVGA